MWDVVFARRTAQLRGDRCSRNRNPRPIELVKGTGGGLENNEQGQIRSAGGGEESSMSLERKQFLRFSGGGTRQDPNYTTMEMCCTGQGPGLDRPSRHLGDAPSKMVAPSIPTELGGVGAPTFAVAPQPP